MNTVHTARFPASRVIGWAAAACWIAAWFLPVIQDYPGWAAFRAAISGPFRDPFPVGGEEAVPQVLSALTNVAFVVLFALWARRRVTRPTLFLKVALACLLMNVYWLVQALRAGEARGLLIGYYAWLAAFVLLVALGALSAVSARRTSKTPTAGTPA